MTATLFGTPACSTTSPRHKAANRVGPGRSRNIAGVIPAFNSIAMFAGVAIIFGLEIAKLCSG